MSGAPGWVYILFTAVTALGVLMQALVLLGMLIALKAALTRLNEVSKLAQEHAIPALAAARHLLEDVSPKLKSAADNVVEVSQKLRTESAHVNETVDDLLRKAEGQAERVDEMVTATLNSIAHATAAMQRVVSAPVRQVGAVLNGLRAGFDVLRSKEREPFTADEEPVVYPRTPATDPDRGRVAG